MYTPVSMYGICVCVAGDVSMHVHTCVHVWRAEVVTHCLPLLCPTFCGDTVSLLNEGLSILVRLAGQ